MRFTFKALPGQAEDHLRPAIPVVVEGLAHAPQLCLIDTGTLHNRFGAWVAEEAGVELAGAESGQVAVGGVITTARQAFVHLTVANHTWDAPIWFCDPWPFSFHLLGQEGFLRWFDVRIRAAEYILEVTPER